MDGYRTRLHLVVVLIVGISAGVAQNSNDLPQKVAKLQSQVKSLQAVQGSLQCRGNIGYNTKFITGSVSTVTGDIYTVRYTKKRSDTILRITANFDARNKDHMNSCVRYYITIDGEECYPKKLDSILYTYVAPISHVQLHTRQHMTGFCNINSTGEKKITLKLGKCCSNCRFGWPFTGRLSTSMMLVEEVCRPGY